MPANCAATRTATVPLSMSQTSVGAAKPLRPVRSTLVAPILPEPMVRTSRPAGRARDQQAERDRAEQIAEQQSEHVRLMRIRRPCARRRSCASRGRSSALHRTACSCTCDFSSAGSRTHGTSMSMTMRSAGAPLRSVPPASPSSSAGRVDIARSKVISSSSPACTSRKPATSMVSSPMAPAAASAKGRRLVSTSCGL